MGRSLPHPPRVTLIFTCTAFVFFSYKGIVCKFLSAEGVNSFKLADDSRQWIFIHICSWFNDWESLSNSCFIEVAALTKHYFSVQTTYYHRQWFTGRSVFAVTIIDCL